MNKRRRYKAKSRRRSLKMTNDEVNAINQQSDFDPEYFYWGDR